MSSSKQDYKNNKKNNKYDRKQQQNNKFLKYSSIENQDIPEGMYDKLMKPTSAELSYIYHEKEEKTYNSDCSDLLLKDNSNQEQDTKKNNVENDIGESTFNDDYFTQEVYIKKK